MSTMKRKVVTLNILFFLSFLFLAGTLYDFIWPTDIQRRSSTARQLRGKERGPTSDSPHEYICFSTHAYYGYTNACSPNTSHGFVKEHSLKENRQLEKSKTFRILVLGGSVASHLTRRVSFEDIFYSTSKNYPEFADRFPGGVSVFNAAIEGYKQPQQTIVLLTLLTEGYRFDSVVNVAGFNEITLPLAENKSRSISPLLPREQNRREEKEIVLHTPVGDLASVLEIHPLGRVIGNKLVQAYAKLLNIKSTKPYSFNMPDTEHNWYIQAKRAWIESSSMSFIIAKSKGIPYFEYIQPNQYISGSKPLSSKELTIAIGDNDYLYRWPAEKYYATIDSEEFLIPKDNVFDGRNAFINERETIYTDACCHMNSHGMSLIGNSISNMILRHIFGRTQGL